MNKYNSFHNGYVDGLKGSEPRPNDSYCKSEYENGWLYGYTDRSAGMEVPAFLQDGYAVPVITDGDTVTLKPGSSVRSMKDGVKESKKKRVITVNHQYPMIPAYMSYHGEISRPQPPRVVWVGSGGYWCETSVENVISKEGDAPSGV